MESKSKTLEKVSKPEAVASRYGGVARHQATSFSSGGFGFSEIQQAVGNLAIQRMFRSGGIQAKLTVNQPGDEYEQEADQVAEHVMRMPVPEAVQKGNFSGYPQRIRIQRMFPQPDEVRRQPEEEEGEELSKEPVEEEFLQAKESPGHTPSVTPDLHTRIDSLRGGGQPLPESTRAFMEPRFGYDFSNVRIHTDEQAAESARALKARAYTVGQNVIFGARQYAPETGEGRKLLAHELTHVVRQQRNPLFSGKAIVNLSSETLVLRQEIKEAPTGLKTETAEEKANRIKQAMKKWFYQGDEIVKIFKSVASLAEFMQIQKNLDMSSVIDYLHTWDAVQVGVLGPLVSGRDKMNLKRAEFVVEVTHDSGLAKAEVSTYFVFNSMYTDDMKEVLKKLAEDRRLKETIEQMEAVKVLITKRGVKLSDYQDIKAPIRDVVRAVGRKLWDLLSSGDFWQIGSSIERYNIFVGLPEEYQKMWVQVMTAEVEQSITPTNLSLGLANELLLGIPGGVYGFFVGIVHGVQDISKGNIEKGTYELTGSLIFLLMLLGFTVKVVGAAKGKEVPPTSGTSPPLKGPTGPGQFVLPSYTGPIVAEEALMERILQLSPEGQAAAKSIMARLGKEGVIQVGRYVQDNSKAAVFVFEHGERAVVALQKAGYDLAKAQELLAAESKSAELVANLPPAPKVTTKGHFEFPHEEPQAKRFGQLLGGGEFKALGDSSRGIEGFFTPKGSTEQIPVSLKDFSGTGRLANIIGRINVNAYQIKMAVQAGKGGKAGTAVLHASLPQFTADKVRNFVLNGPIIKMPHEGVFVRLFFDCADGVVEVGPGGLR